MDYTSTALVLMTQAVVLLERGQTDKQTDRQTRPNSLQCIIITVIMITVYYYSINASNTNSYLSPTKFLQLPNLHAFTTSSLFSVLLVLALHPSLLLLGHLHHPFLKLPIAHFGMLNHVSGIDSLYLFVKLILVPVPLFRTHLFLHPSLLPLLFHHCAYP